MSFDGARTHGNWSPMDPGRFRWRKAEKLAGVEHRKRAGWHCFHRRFASEYDELPMHLLCELGGWKSPQTVMKCYQSVQEDQKREALERRRESQAPGQFSVRFDSTNRQ